MALAELGAMIATLVWLVASWLFSFYLQNFADYNATYGSLRRRRWPDDVDVDLRRHSNRRGCRQCRDGAPDGVRFNDGATFAHGHARRFRRRHARVRRWK